MGRQAGRGDAGRCARDAGLDVNGVVGAGAVAGKGLGGLPLVETVADGFVGDVRGAHFELGEEVEQRQVDAPASPKEGRAYHVVGGHAQGALTQAALGEGGGGEDGGGGVGACGRGRRPEGIPGNRG